MTSATPALRRSNALLALAVFAWLAALAWARPLMLPDEGRYVGVAWEMLRSGDWLTPTLNGLPYFHKPPLFYWITAASMAIFGPGEWAARAAPLLGAWLAAMATYLLVRRWWDGRVASLSLMALLAMPLFYIGGQFANLDMLVAGLITATIALLAHAALAFEGGLPHRRVLLTSYALAALGVLAKGLIGVVIPAAVVITWLLLTSHGRTLRAMVSPLGLALLLVIAAPWFLAMQARFPGFAEYFFVVQHFKRYAVGGFNNAQPFWFFPAVLLLFTLPWLVWLRAQFARFRLFDGPRAELRVLMVFWLLVVVAFFSLPRSKLIGYILPAVPPLAVLIADGFETIEARFGASSRRAWRWAWGVGAATCVVAIAVFSIHPTRSTREIATLLRDQATADDVVVMLETYRFDLPLYARLRTPVIVVDDWANSEILRRDNWRKELADAGTFAPAAAATSLVQSRSLCARLAGRGTAWVVGSSSAAERSPFLGSARAISTVRGTTLWLVDRADPRLKTAAACEGKPSGDSPST